MSQSYKPMVNTPLLLYLFVCKSICNRLFCIDKLEQYGITSFGVSVTTLEEVFMKVGEGAEKTLHDL